MKEEDSHDINFLSSLHLCSLWDHVAVIHVMEGVNECCFLVVVEPMHECMLGVGIFVGLLRNDDPINLIVCL
jgi:hypothetical protein